MLTETEFDAIRAFPTFAAYEADNRPLLQQTVTSQVNVSDAELVDEIRSLLNPDTSDAFTDEQIIAKLDYSKGLNNFRETVKETVLMLEESKVRQDVSKAAAAAAGTPKP